MSFSIKLLSVILKNSSRIDRFMIFTLNFASNTLLIPLNKKIKLDQVEEFSDKSGIDLLNYILNPFGGIQLTTSIPKHR